MQISFLLLAPTQYVVVLKRKPQEIDVFLTKKALQNVSVIQHDFLANLTKDRLRQLCQSAKFEI